jgi:hypothetical protein
MAYNQFTLARVQADFGVTVQTRTNLFAAFPTAPVDPVLETLLHRQEPLAVAVNTEKVRSELLIAPILTEVWRLGNDRVAMFSGTRFDVDEAAELVGVCDFILGRPPQLHYVTAPFIMIVEAKNEDIAGGLGQCAAAMVAGQRFNRRQNPDIAVMYGAVTDGGEWKFLRLTDRLLEVDLTDYRINQPERILGILLHVVGLLPATAAA